MSARLKEEPSDRLFQPSSLLKRYVSKIVDAASGSPILDLACGSGRNAIYLAGFGCTVICLDRELSRLQAAQTLLRGLSNEKDLVSRLISLQADLARDPWPFGSGVLGGIVNVHFLSTALFPWFKRSLRTGGLLLLETVSGHGANYLELPEEGELKAALGKAFNLEFYQERKVGPRSCDAVTVRLLARRTK